MNVCCTLRRIQLWRNSAELRLWRWKVVCTEPDYSQGQVSKVYLRKVILGSLSQYILISKMDIITILNQMLLKDRAELTYVQRTLCRTGRVKLYCQVQHTVKSQILSLLIKVIFLIKQNNLFLALIFYIFYLI